MTREDWSIPPNPPAGHPPPPLQHQPKSPAKIPCCQTEAQKPRNTPATTTPINESTSINQGNRCEVRAPRAGPHTLPRWPNQPHNKMRASQRLTTQGVLKHIFCWIILRWILLIQKYPHKYLVYHLSGVGAVVNDLPIVVHHSINNLNKYFDFFIWIRGTN